MLRRKHSRAEGFTLVELLIAMAIFMTVMAIAIPNFMAAMDAARVARAVGDIHTLEDEISLYQVIN
ncbi:MAG TPA: prepilin-type N-terminal cleavage/methylation domain-containing protein [Candidatus Acidoferrum sp.]